MSKQTVGIVTAWFERGAAYVSKLYYEALKKKFNVIIFARGGEKYGKGDPKWDFPYVHWGKRYAGFKINKREFFKWIESNNIDILFFNEQREYSILAETKRKYPNIKLGAYVDYYTEDTLPFFNIYDFVICNTERHLQAMQFHKQAKFIRWGTDINLYKPQVEKYNLKKKEVTFFHSVGMSPRKGTNILLKTFINYGLYKTSKLIVHTQIPVEKVSDYNKEQLEKYGIRVIQKTVSAPGLYHLGDVYVYPTRLDGLGLTMYEALSSGLPVITTDYPPMNEVVKSDCGKLVKVAKHYSRFDAYYWPMSVCDGESLAKCMKYYIDNPEKLVQEKVNARKRACKLYNWNKNSQQLPDVFENIKCYPLDKSAYNLIMKYERNKKLGTLKYFANNTFIYRIRHRNN